jgi:methyl-accepting chemotaxis protein
MTTCMDSMSGLPSTETAAAGWLARLWRRLTAPSPGIVNLAVRRQVRLLAGLWLVLAGLTILALVLMLGFQRELIRETTIDEVVLATAILMLVAYGLSRSRWHGLSVLLFILLALAAPFSTAITNARIGEPQNASSVLPALGVLALGMFAPRRFQMPGAVAITAVVIGGWLLLPIAFSSTSSADIIAPLITTLVLIGIFVAYNWHRNQLEADSIRLEAIRQAEMAERARDEQARSQWLEGMVGAYMSFVGRVAQGDLSTRVTFELDEHDTADSLAILGSNLNAMADSLVRMAEQIQTTAATLLQTAGEILVATTQQLASTSEQDVAVTQVVSTTEEIRTTVQHTVAYAASVADLARQSVSVGQTGQDAVSSSVNGMATIRNRVANIAATILAFTDKAEQVEDIIITVNEIADQSKLLALNAAIEAARAGEGGRGFAVVATEIRDLAEQSRQATNQAQAILTEIRQATDSAVTAAEEGLLDVEVGMQMVNQAGDSIAHLARLLDQAASAAEQIASRTDQQSGGMEQLASAMTAIRQATAQAQAGARQTEQAAQNLNRMAHDMQQAIARYRLE